MRPSYPPPILLTMPPEIRLEIYKHLLYLPPDANPFPSSQCPNNSNDSSHTLFPPPSTSFGYVGNYYTLASGNNLPPSPPNELETETETDVNNPNTNTAQPKPLQQPPPPSRPRPFLYPAILRVCAQTHAEGTEVLYEHNAFLADDYLLTALPRLRPWFPPVRATRHVGRIRRW